MEEIQILAEWELYFSKLWVNMKDCDLTTEDGKREFARIILMEVHSDAMKTQNELKAIMNLLTHTTQLAGTHNDAIKRLYDALGGKT